MVGFSAPPCDSNSAAAGAAKYLADLPSRGLFTSTLLSSNPGGMRVYVCDHDTSPRVFDCFSEVYFKNDYPKLYDLPFPAVWPDDQLIKTNQTNILIRSLTLKKQKAESSSKDVKGSTAVEASRKRPGERALDGRASAKRAATDTQVGSPQEGSKSRVPEKDFRSLTVERLRALLKEKGLSPRGKKDELIARLRGS